MRLFAAVPLPLDVLQRFTDLRLRLATPKDGLRWSPSDQAHITLRFLGEVSEDEALMYAESLKRLHSAPVHLAIESLGIFGAKGILYASLVSSAELGDLQAQVERCVTEHGALPETRPFLPHLTLARSKNRTGMNTLQRLSRPGLPALGGVVRWTATEVLLYESLLSPGGAEHRVLARYPLNG
ncbi:MAG: RNA 2',3'-cyclic phosphodiesterase [Janthinobacterium lividum]